MTLKYIVDLTEALQGYLLNLIKKGKSSARKVARAHVLLRAAERATDDEMAQALHRGVSMVHRTHQRFVEEGLMIAKHGFNAITVVALFSFGSGGSKNSRRGRVAPFINSNTAC